MCFLILIPLTIVAVLGNASVKTEHDVFNVTLGKTLSIPVTGRPLPAIVLENSGSISKCQLKGGMLEFGPVELSDHGITYSITASNCFNSVTESFAVNVLSKCWPVWWDV